MEADRLTQLIGERVIGNRVTGDERFHDARHAHRGTGSGLQPDPVVRDLHDLVDPAVGRRHQHAKRHGIAHEQAGQLVRVLHVKRHRHLLHVAGDRLVFDVDERVGRVEAADQPFDRENLEVRVRRAGGRRRRGGRFPVAGHGQKARPADE
jgi:hypothetical protein